MDEWGDIWVNGGNVWVSGVMYGSVGDVWISGVINGSVGLLCMSNVYYVWAIIGLILG